MSSTDGTPPVGGGGGDTDIDARETETARVAAGGDTARALEPGWFANPELAIWLYCAHRPRPTGTQTAPRNK